MNPIVHAEVGWLVGSLLERKRDRVIVTIAAVISDVDGLSIVAGEDAYAQWHHRIAHGAIAATIVTAIALAWSRSPKVATLALVAFHTHIAMDLVGSGPGWPILYWWPFDDVEWLPPWQWDLASWQNALFGFASTIACLACGVVIGRTPVELVSSKADTRVVATLRTRFRRGARVIQNE